MNHADIERAVDTLQRNNPQHAEWCPLQNVRQRLDDLLGRCFDQLKAHRDQIDRADITAWIDEAASIGVLAGQERRICEACAQVLR